MSARRWLALKLAPEFLFFVRSPAEPPSSRSLARRTLEFLYVECRFIDDETERVLKRLSKGAK